MKSKKSKSKRNAKPKAKGKKAVKTNRPGRVRRQSVRRSNRARKVARKSPRKKVNLLATRKGGVHANRKPGNNKRIARKKKPVNRKVKEGRKDAQIKRLKKQLQTVKAKLKKRRKGVKAKVKAKPQPKKRKLKNLYNLKFGTEITQDETGTFASINLPDVGADKFDFIKRGDFDFLQPLIEKNKQPDGSFKFPQAVIVSIESKPYKNKEGKETTFLRSKMSPPDMEITTDTIKDFIQERLKEYSETFEAITDRLEDDEQLTDSSEASNPENAAAVHIKFIY